MKIVYVERKPNEYVSIEKVFRGIAAALRPAYESEFQQLPYGLGPVDTIRNLLFFRRRAADIYHITGHVNYIALIFHSRNTVLTFHDLRFVHESNPLKRFMLKKLYLDLPVRRLKYITAISEHTKREIVENTRCNTGKIRVLPPPVSEVPVSGSHKEFNRSSPLLLQVGTMPNKNIERLTNSVSGLECTLRILGRLSETQVAHLQSSGVQYENAYDLDDDAMRAEYLRADIVTFCSTYEGFGLPIIEAQAAGKPVITSNFSPMTDTAGRGACLVDPYDVESIRSGIRRIIEDDLYRQGIVEMGFENVKRFRAESVVPQYEQLYTEIVETMKGGDS